jgi:sortase A
MKFILYVFTGIVGMIAGIIILSFLPSPNAQTDDFHTPVMPSVTAAVSPEPTFTRPIRLSIPSISVDTTIEEVGLDTEGRMDVPKDYDAVGWYNLGPYPGEEGNAVLAGHLDSPTAPAVFWNLSNLMEGDEFMVTDVEGRELTFTVVQKTLYENENFPLDEVFGATNQKRLNLITCDGTFDQNSKLYSHRLVIYSELKSE